MIRALGKIPLSAAFDAAGLALLAAAALVLHVAAGLAVAGVAFLLLSWRYAP